jgi:transcription elongation GreA/GreB family factor
MVGNGVVGLGSRVRLRDADGEDEFTIVPPEQVDVLERRISEDSPLAHALLGRAAGEQVKVEAPGGARPVEILEVV